MSVISIIEKCRKINAGILSVFHPDSLLSMGEVCSITGGKPPSDNAGISPDKKFSLISCFDGAFAKGCLYVHFDRNPDSAARAAMGRGALALLSTKQIDGFPCILVDDTLLALQQITRYLWQKIKIPATVVTGSVGKTSAKNFVNCVYETGCRTFCNLTNGNTLEYMGYELQRFDAKARLFVQEVNESDPMNTAYCSEALNPEIALITNIDRSHIGEMGGQENIIRAVCDITRGMDEKGTVILNGDDANSCAVSFRQRVIRVAIRNREAECTASDIVQAGEAISFVIHYEGKSTPVSLRVGGEHNVYNAMMAFAAGRLNGIPEEKIVAGLRKYRPLGFRQNIYRDRGRTIYADCYNASAKSIRAALSAIEQLPANRGKRIAVLGDIAEIEGYEEETYREIGENVNASAVDALVTYGPDSKQILSHITRKDLACYEAREQEELCGILSKITGKNDVVLFKASRTMALEAVIRKLYPIAYVKGMLPVGVAFLKWTVKTL